MVVLAARPPGGGAQEQVRQVTWTDLAPLRDALQARGLTSTGFAAYVERVRTGNARRVREGDLDHLVFYLLQSTQFTALPPIEPALSARGFVESLDGSSRDTFLRTGTAPAARVPAAVSARLKALLPALRSSSSDPRLRYFRDLVDAAFPSTAEREQGLIREYLRAMRFVYEKEFIAQRGPRAGDAVAELYRTRGLSTDTAVEAGYLVHLGLGIVRSLHPDRRIRRVLIVGPGLDLAPRTGLTDAGPPESYQPWAIVDALLALGISRADDLEVVAADINPRVVAHLRRARTAPPTLTLVSGIAENATLAFSADYREYFLGLGRAVAVSGGIGATDVTADGRLRKTVRVAAAAAQTIRAEALDIVTERLTEPPFDLVIATNILPYFDDVQVMLAMANIGAMLVPGGTLLHNEARPLLREVSASLGLPVEQSRHAIIATVRGAPAPLGDSVWVHRKRGRNSEF